MFNSRVTGKIPATLATLALVAGLGITGTAPASAAYCGITWGSLSKTSSSFSSAQVTNVRSGQHDCFDRLVIDLRGKVTGYRIGYVSTVYTEGGGFAVPLRGNADLRVTVIAPAYNEWGQSTYFPTNRSEVTNVAGYQTFRQIAWAGSQGGQTTLGLGVRARLPFRAFVLDAPGGGSRLVVDVADFW